MLLLGGVTLAACSSGPPLPTAAQDCANLMSLTRTNNGPPDSTVTRSATDVLWIYGPNSGGGFRYFEFKWSPPPCTESGPSTIRP